MSRPNVTDEVVDGLDFARACVLDQRAASHNRKDHSWDKRYAAALSAIDAVVGAHKRSVKEKGRKAKSYAAVQASIGTVVRALGGSKKPRRTP